MNDETAGGDTAPILVGAPGCISTSPRKNDIRHSSSYMDQGENFDLRNDATHVVQEVSFAVQSATLSQVMPKEESIVHINLTTLEGDTCCIELTERGYRIVALEHDKFDQEYVNKNPPYYETLSTLLDQLSPRYREEFGKALIGRLKLLQAEQQCESL